MSKIYVSKLILIIVKNLSVIVLFFLLLVSSVMAQNADFVDCTIPNNLITDEVFYAEIRMRNTGTQNWGADQGETAVTLVSKNPNFNNTWGTYFISLGQGNSIAPGETFTFHSYLKAPSEPGVYSFSWQCQNWLPIGGMDDLNSPFFGEITSGITINVTQRTEQPPISPIYDKTMLDSADFEYLGSFVVPGLPNFDDAYTESGITIKKNGQTKSLLLLTGTYDFNLYEINIPSLVKVSETNHSSINTANVIRNWGNLNYGTINGENIKANRGFWFDNETRTLYWTHFNYYFTGGSSDFPMLLATRLNSNGTKENIGYWYFPNNLSEFKGYWGGITVLSDNFANSYTGGRKLALGFGGYYCICGTASRGPALAAISTPVASNRTLDILPMLSYPDPNACIRSGNYMSNIGYWENQPASPWKGFWTGIDACGTGVFIDLPDQKGYMVFAYQGIGRLGYDFGGHNFDGKYQHNWYFYDIKDLAASATGSKDISDIQPTSFCTINYPLNGEAVSGACFDEETRTLYIYSRLSCNNKPAIHAYYLKQSTIASVDNTTIHDIASFQNYPNPFSSSTTIEYSLNRTEKVTLSVYSSQGAKIATLVNSVKQKGVHQVSFDGNNLPVGIYLIELNVGNYKKIQKCVLTK
jgi:hypothetical protein